LLRAARSLPARSGFRPPRRSAARAARRDARAAPSHGATGRDEAIVDRCAGCRSGPTTASSLAIAGDRADAALLALESEGVVLRGRFTPARRARPLEWCDRMVRSPLLARIHRYTLNRLRAEIEPVSPADFMRFLFVWQHVEPSIG
jgi:hypothetical protein